MKSRFFLSKSLLIVASFFWASCGEDDTQPISINVSTTESSSSLEPSSSENSLPQSSNPNSSGATEGISSGTTEPSSSSSVGDLSSSSAKQYKLASDTSVTCTATTVPYNECVYPGSSSEMCNTPENKLQFNTTLTIEELIKIEDRLENCVEAVPAYGTPSCMNQMRVRTDFKCSNGITYTNLKEKDDLIYTNSEYDSLFNSSSNEASSSSAAPSPICQKTDFEKKSTVTHNSINEKLDSLTAAGDTVSDNLKKCVNDTLHTSHVGEYAKTQICDGDTTVNPRYQAKLDSIREEVGKAIEDCKAAEVPTDSTKTPADSTDTPKDSTGTPADTTNTPA